MLPLSKCLSFVNSAKVGSTQYDEAAHIAHQGAGDT